MRASNWARASRWGGGRIDPCYSGTIRRAFGYPVFENFRLQVMAEQGNLPTPSPQI